jgi:serine/threonine-protein kinase
MTSDFGPRTRHLVTAFDDPDFLLRFQNEAASTGRIHHANVVTIYESGQADDGTPYIAMEFLEGESLRQALARRSTPQRIEPGV